MYASNIISWEEGALPQYLVRHEGQKLYWRNIFCTSRLLGIRGSVSAISVP